MRRGRTPINAGSDDFVDPQHTAHNQADKKLQPWVLQKDISSITSEAMTAHIVTSGVASPYSCDAVRNSQ